MSGLLMECVMALVTESTSLGEMLKLHKLSTWVSDVLREWLDDQIQERYERRMDRINVRHHEEQVMQPGLKGKKET